MVKYNSRYFLLSWLLLPFVGFSQDEKPVSFWKNSSFGSRFHYGAYLTTKSKAEYIRDSYASFGEIYFQHQTNGNQDWQVSHKYPQWGISFLYGNTGSRQYIGNMSALYAFMNVPLYARKNYTTSLLLGTGPGWVSKPFDINRNPKNVLIGTRLNAFVNLQWQHEIRLATNFYLTAGIGFMHLSNGGTTLPNLGLNTPVLNGGIRYSLATPVIEKRKLTDTFRKKTRIKVYTTIALKQAPWVGGNHYTINNVQAEISRRVKRNYSIGAGTLLSYNRALNFFPLENPSYEKRDKKKIQAGLYAAYEHFFGRLSIPLQLGGYIYNRGNNPAVFHQFGLAYQFSNHINGVLLLKSHMGQADFIHTGIGYTF